MRVKILECMVGEKSYDANTVYEIPEPTALHLIKVGRAVAVDEPVTIKKEETKAHNPAPTPKKIKKKKVAKRNKS